jgi:hypothetical protein
VGQAEVITIGVKKVTLIIFNITTTTTTTIYFAPPSKITLHDFFKIYKHYRTGHQK